MYERIILVTELWKETAMLTIGAVGISLLIHIFLFPKDKSFEKEK